MTNERLYPMHHFGAVAVTDDKGLKCSGCGFRPDYDWVESAEKSVNCHITMKQKWEKEWKKCPTCNGAGKVRR